MKPPYDQAYISFICTQIKCTQLFYAQIGLIILVNKLCFTALSLKLNEDTLYVITENKLPLNCDGELLFNFEQNRLIICPTALAC